MHRLLAEGLEQAGFGVVAEMPYPTLHVPSPRRAERERCDLVLTADPASRPADPLQLRRQIEQAAGTLFESLAPKLAHHHALVPPEEAFWLEVKLVAQIAYREAVPVPNRSYAAELVGGPRRDLAKLAADRRIVHGGVALVLFTADQRTADHDLAELQRRLVRADVPVIVPAATRGFPITDRAGNGWCSVSLLALAPRGQPMPGL